MSLFMSVQVFRIDVEVAQLFDEFGDIVYRIFENKVPCDRGVNLFIIHPIYIDRTYAGTTHQ